MAGVGYDLHGDEQGSMGVDCGDFDNDGWLDFYVTSYQGQLATLYRNSGDGFFEDVTLAQKAGTGTLPNVTWGTSFVDFDNDGRRDLFVACGHLQDNVELYDGTATYHERNLLLRNTGQGGFEEIGERSGSGLGVTLSSRGAGFDDLDGDGDVDIIVLNSRREPTILRNDTPRRHHWLQIRLRGTRGNTHGVGAQVRVTAGSLQLLDEVHSGRGYQSHHGLRLHFGLGKQTKVDRIEVRWIGGGRDVLVNQEVDRELVIQEGRHRDR
jgi:hypothetical protein